MEGLLEAVQLAKYWSTQWKKIDKTMWTARSLPMTDTAQNEEAFVQSTLHYLKSANRTLQLQ